MRKSFGVFVAVATMLSMVVMTAPSGAAAATPTCNSAAGTFKFTPSLPASGGVLANLSSAGTVTGCAGGGVTSGKTVFTQTTKSTTKSSCATLAKPTGKPTVGKFVVTWNNGKTSTATGVQRHAVDQDHHQRHDHRQDHGGSVRRQVDRRCGELQAVGRRRQVRRWLVHRREGCQVRHQVANADI